MHQVFFYFPGGIPMDEKEMRIYLADCRDYWQASNLCFTKINSSATIFWALMKEESSDQFLGFDLLTKMYSHTIEIVASTRHPENPCSAKLKVNLKRARNGVVFWLCKSNRMACHLQQQIVLHIGPPSLHIWKFFPLEWRFSAGGSTRTNDTLLSPTLWAIVTFGRLLNSKCCLFPRFRVHCHVTNSKYALDLLVTVLTADKIKL